MTTVNLSAAVLTHNSERTLRACLTSLSFADELLVIDDGSTDSTITIATELGARVIPHAMAGDFSAQRRFAIEQCQGQWVLFIDSDEVVSDALKDSILQAVLEPPLFSYSFSRVNRFPHYRIEHGSMRSDTVTRLFPKEGLSSEGRVHEKILSPYPTKKLDGALLHYPYRDWSATIRKLDQYTSFLAQQQFEKGKPTSFLAGTLLKPTWAFLKVYFLNRGFLDGKIGLMFAIHHAYYTFMKYAKYHLLANSKGTF